jgi:hypothetical protein
MDIDRNEQKAGLKRRERRWKEIESELASARKAEKIAIKNAEKMGNSREPNMIEQAWLRCDYVLSNLMEPKAYKFMELVRVKDPECYKRLYRIFMSKNTMHHIQYFVDYFASGGTTQEPIKFSSIIKEYRKIKGIKSKFTVKHKGEDDFDL